MHFVDENWGLGMILWHQEPSLIWYSYFKYYENTHKDARLTGELL